MRSEEELNYGIGYLDVLNIDDYYYDWPRYVVLPLWAAPDESSFQGWIQSGRVYPHSGAAPISLTGAGLVETDYESSRFIVFEASADGWVRIRLKPGEGGHAWTHTCHLELGKARLAYKDWKRFLRGHGDWLHFRRRVPHSLRRSPDANSSLVATIGLDHKLVLREIQGDWMQVTVEQPDQTCRGEPEAEFSGTIHEGWVKWRDEEKGPWVWVYTRGC